MTRSLSTRNAALAGELVLRPIPLVTLTTYSNYGSQTVDEVFRWSNRDCVYDGDLYASHIQRIDSLTASMPHMPSPDGNDGTFQRSLSMVLRDGDYDGTQLSELLEATNLHFATVEVSQVLLAEGERIEDLDGDEHDVFYRGELREYALDNLELRVRFESVLPRIPIDILPNDSETAPRDRGKLRNEIYGDIQKVPLHGVSVGAVTTSAASLDREGLLLYVTDVSDFPYSGSGTLNNESIVWEATGANVIQLAGRTNARFHNAGSVVVYTPEEVKFVAAQEGCDVDELYMRNLLNGELFRMDSAGYTVDDSDNGPFGSGNEVTTVAMTTGELRAAINEAVSDATVTQQPDFAASDDPTTEVVIITPDQSRSQTKILDTHILAYYCRNWAEWASPAATSPVYEAAANYTDRWYLHSGTFDDTHTEWSSTDANEDREIVRWRHRFDWTQGNYTRLHDDVRIAVKLKGDWDELPGTTQGDGHVITWSDDLDGTSGSVDVEMRSSWKTVGDGTTLGDFRDIVDTEALNYHVFVWYADDGADNGSATFVVDNWGIEFEVTASGAVQQTQDAQISAAAGGVGLELFADVRAPQVPDSAYERYRAVIVGSAQHNIIVPVDMVRYVLEERCGIARARLDGASFTETDERQSIDGLGGNQNDEHWYPAIEMMQYGPDLASQLAPLLFDTRMQLLTRETNAGTEWYLQTPAYSTPSATYYWPGTPREITQWQSIRMSSRLGEDVANEWRILLQRDWSQLAGQVDGYMQGVTEETTRVYGGLVLVSQLAYGARQHPGFSFDTLGQSADHVECYSSYYMRAGMDTPLTWTINGIPWIEGYDLERGDLIEFTPEGRAQVGKARIIVTTKHWQTELVDVVCVEVN